MELVNHTRFPAALFRGVVGDDLLYGSLVARVTYDLADGALTVSEEQPWKVSGPPWDTEYGQMQSDELFYKGGVDLFVFGHARGRDGQAVEQTDVHIEVGSFRRQVKVFGDRVWQRQGESLVPSAPQPFTAMPLTLAHAFGGTDVWDELPVPLQENPGGKGYYLEAENAVGQPLPNVEDPDRLIRNWNDRPDPVGLGPCPYTCALRLRDSVVFDGEGMLKVLKPTFFNAAFPGMIVPRVEPGQRVRLGGVSDAGVVGFTIPRTTLSIRLQFDEQVIESPLAIDQVGVEVDKRRVFLAYRYPFKYHFVPLQRRSCELFSEPVA